MLPVRSQWGLYNLTRFMNYFTSKKWWLSIATFDFRRVTPRSVEMRGVNHHELKWASNTIPIVVSLGFHGLPLSWNNLYMNIYGGFLKWGYPQIINFIRLFNYKLTVLGIHHLGKQPYIILRGSSWQAVSLLSQTAWDLETVTLHFWQWKLSCNVLFKCNVELYYI
jgi:hypothetical protein